MDKHCSIIFLEGRINIVPSMVSLATLLEEKGFDVTFFCRKNKFATDEKDFADDFRPNVVYFDPPSGYLSGRLIWRAFLLLRLGSLLNLLDVIIFFLQIRLYKFRVAASRPGDALIIGTDNFGLLASWFESKWAKAGKTAFLSLELRQEASFRKLDKIRLYLTKRAYRKVDCVLVQDEDRFSTLGKTNKFVHPKVFYLPNSALGPVNVENSGANYFRKLFVLDEKRYRWLIVQTGMINDKVYSKEIVEAFAGVGEECALIFHERQKRDRDDPYLKQLGALNSKNFFLSTDPLPYKDLHRIFEAIDIGIAFYRDFNENFGQISKASGKLAQYLQAGKPVLMNDSESLQKLNDQYDFGVNVKNPSSSKEIAAALRQITGSYEYYRRNALKCFEKEFEFRGKAAPFLDFIGNDCLQNRRK